LKNCGRRRSMLTNRVGQTIVVCGLSSKWQTTKNDRLPHSAKKGTGR
jgi:hypothetical protein